MATYHLYSFQQLLSTPVVWFVFVFGALLGSFLNVCIFRLPEGNFWKHSRSICFSCHKKIPVWQNIPIFSYLLLRGRSRCCGQSFSSQYLLVELLTPVLFVLIYWRFPFVTGQWGEALGVHLKDFIRFFHAASFCSLMIICSFIDFRHMIIPDEISLSMVALTPVIIYMHPELNWFSGLLGAIIGGGVIYLIAWVYYLLRKREGIGMGDAKLLAAIGGWLGYQAIVPTLFYGSVVGTLTSVIYLGVSRRFSFRAEIPFGPFLALGALFHLLSRTRIEDVVGYFLHQ